MIRDQQEGPFLFLSHVCAVGVAGMWVKGVERRWGTEASGGVRWGKGVLSLDLVCGGQQEAAAAADGVF